MIQTASNLVGSEETQCPQCPVSTECPVCQDDVGSQEIEGTCPVTGNCVWVISF